MLFLTGVLLCPPAAAEQAPPQDVAGYIDGFDVSLCSIALSPDGQFAYVAGGRSAGSWSFELCPRAYCGTRVYEIDTSNHTFRTVITESRQVTRLTFPPGADKLYGLVAGEAVRAYSPGSWAGSDVIADVDDMAISADGEWLYAMVGWRVKAVRLSDGQVMMERQDDAFQSICSLSADGSTLYIATVLGFAVLRTSDLATIARVDAGRNVKYLTPSPDGAYLYASFGRPIYQDGVHVFRTSDYTDVANIAMTSTPSLVVPTTDGRYLYALQHVTEFITDPEYRRIYYDELALIRIADFTVAERVRIPPGNRSRLCKLALSPDNTRIYAPGGQSVTILAHSEDSLAIADPTDEAPACEAWDTFIVRDIAPAYGPDGFTPTALNDRGQIVGVIAGPPQQAAIWTPNDGLRILPIPAPSLPNDINNNGQIVGWYEPDGQKKAFVWDGDTGLHDLPTLGVRPNWATSINDAGDIVGSSWTDIPWTETYDMHFIRGPIGCGDGCGCWHATDGKLSLHGFLYRAGEMIDLGTFGGAHSVATYVDEDGVVYGTAETAETRQTLDPDAYRYITELFRWDSGEMTALTTDSRSATKTLSDIDAQGRGIGASTFVYPEYGYNLNESYLFVPSGAPDFDTGETGVFDYGTRLTGINASGEIVGRRERAHETNNDCPHCSLDGLYIRDDGLHVLNEFVPAASTWDLRSGIDINDLGQVVGIGHRFGYPHVFLMTPKAVATDAIDCVDPQEIVDPRGSLNSGGASGGIEACPLAAAAMIALCVVGLVKMRRSS